LTRLFASQIRHLVDKYGMLFSEFLINDYYQELLAILVEWVDPVVKEAVFDIQYAQNIIQDAQFRQWLASLGVTGGIGKGMPGNIGWAFPVGNQFFVKFTPSRHEAIAADAIQKSQPPNTAKVYGVIQKGVFIAPRGKRPKPLYAIVTERLNTDTGKKYRIAGNAIHQYMQNHYEPLTNIDAAYNDIITNFPSKLRNDQSLMNIVKSLLTNIFNISQTTGVTIRDTHGGNAALKGRTPAYFDFGQSYVDQNRSNSQFP
jgi:hypothetical protein